MSRGLQSIAVFCGASPGRNPAFRQCAVEVGRFLARRGIRLVYGGGSVGMMGAVADACLEAGGEVVGVITEYLDGLELGHKGVTRLDVVGTMAERKDRMAELSDAFVTLPGGVGTLDELAEMLTWSRLALHDKPSGLLNVEGYYDELYRFLTRTQVEAGFIREEEAKQLLVAEEIESLVEMLEAASCQDLVSPYRA